MGSHPSHSRGVFTRRQAAQRHPHVAPRLLAAALMASVAVLWLASGTHAAQEEGLRGQAGQVTGTGGAAAAEVPRTSSRNTTIATIDTTSISNSSSSRGPGPGSGLWQSLPGSLRNALAALLRGSSGRGPGHGSGQRHQGLKSAVLPGPAAPNASTEPLVKGPDAEQKAQEPGQLVGQVSIHLLWGLFREDGWRCHCRRHSGASLHAACKLVKQFRVPHMILSHVPTPWTLWKKETAPCSFKPLELPTPAFAGQQREQQQQWRHGPGQAPQQAALCD